ncbi:MAG: hypothetical protein IJ203_08675 [Atopobiaceae bacterium]|nr:hypothetical protein [Atopobiaceae bacterium]
MKPKEISPDVAERAQEVQSAEQMRAFLNDEGFELTDEQLEAVVGGVNFVQGFKTVLGPYLYPPCPAGGLHEFEEYVDPKGEAVDKVRCVKCGTVY